MSGLWVQALCWVWRLLKILKKKKKDQARSAVIDTRDEICKKSTWYVGRRSSRSRKNKCLEIGAQWGRKSEIRKGSGTYQSLYTAVMETWSWGDNDLTQTIPAISVENRFGGETGIELRRLSEGPVWASSRCSSWGIEERIGWNYFKKENQ